MQEGKTQNLRRAVRAFDGVVVPAGETLSFWRQLGRVTRRRGFVDGRELRDGCLIPAVGGGLCQLSNALYDLALRTGAEIVERHAHTHLVPGSPVAEGRDATIAWNYIDLRFRPQVPIRLEVRLTAGELVVAFWGTDPPDPGPRRASRRDDGRRLTVAAPAAAGCDSCGETDCFRHTGRLETAASDPLATAGPVAFVVDGATPELVAHLRSIRRPADRVLAPLDGALWGVDRYRWEEGGRVAGDGATRATLAGALRIRRAARRGPAAVRAASLARDERVAATLARHLRPEHTHLVVSQSLVAFLWREGVLGGRTYDVLGHRLTLAELHQRLDDALARFPDRRALGDFRAPDELVVAEAEALAAARSVVTAHVGLAGAVGARAVVLPWAGLASAPVPVRASRPSPSARLVLGFAGPLVERTGASDVAAAAAVLGAEVQLLPAAGTAADHPAWAGVTVRTATHRQRWLDQVDVVVQPSIAEERPAALLAALAAGVPVVAGEGSGLPAHPLLREVAYGDGRALEAAIVASSGGSRG